MKATKQKTRRWKNNSNPFLDPYRDGFEERCRRHNELMALQAMFEAEHGRLPSARELWDYEMEMTG